MSAQIQLAEEDIIQHIMHGAIHPDPDQPRKHFDEQALNDLAADIKARGIIEPIIYRIDEAGKNIIVAGERRCGIQLEGNYTIDQDYLDIKLKQEIIDIVPATFPACQDDDYWNKLCKGPAGKLKDTLLQDANLFGVPADLIAMYLIQEDQ